MSTATTTFHTREHTSTDHLANSVTVIIPCYNESESLTHLFESLDEMRLDSPHLTWQIMFINDGSNDNTAELIDAYCAHRTDSLQIHHSNNVGIAAAIETGLRHAQSEFVCTIDSDGTYDPSILPRMVEMMDGGTDIVTASPYHPNGRVENVPRWRLLLSRISSTLYRCLMRTKLHTYTSCCRAYRTSRVNQLNVSNRGFVGVAELLWIADRAGLSIVEYPAVLKTRQYGESKMKVLATTMAHLRLLCRVILND